MIEITFSILTYFYCTLIYIWIIGIYFDANAEADSSLKHHFS